MSVDVHIHNSTDIGLLLCNTLERRVIVEAEIASVDDVVCLCIAGELV